MKSLNKLICILKTLYLHQFWLNLDVLELHFKLTSIQNFSLFQKCKFIMKRPVRTKIGLLTGLKWSSLVFWCWCSRIFIDWSWSWSYQKWVKKPDWTRPQNTTLQAVSAHCMLYQENRNLLLLSLDDSKWRKRNAKGLLWILLAKDTKRLDPLLATTFNALWLLYPHRSGSGKFAEPWTGPLVQFKSGLVLGSQVSKPWTEQYKLY